MMSRLVAIAAYVALASVTVVVAVVFSLSLSPFGTSVAEVTGATEIALVLVVGVALSSPPAG